jgi:hypothetical protein
MLHLLDLVFTPKLFFGKPNRIRSSGIGIGFG